MFVFDKVNEAQLVKKYPFFSPMCNWLLGKVLCRRYPPSSVDSSWPLPTGHPQEPLGRGHPSSAAPFRPAPLAAPRRQRCGDGHGAGGGFQRARGQRVAWGAPKWRAGRSTGKLEVSGCLAKCFTITHIGSMYAIYGVPWIPSIYHNIAQSC